MWKYHIPQNRPIRLILAPYQKEVKRCTHSLLAFIDESCASVWKEIIRKKIKESWRLQTLSISPSRFQVRKPARYFPFAETLLRMRDGNDKSGLNRWRFDEDDRRKVNIAGANTWPWQVSSARYPLVWAEITCLKLIKRIAGWEKNIQPVTDL